MGREDRIPLDPAEITREFARVRRGYDPAAVDHHLALIKSKVKTLLELGVREPDESYDLVMKATKKSIDEAFVESRSRAASIIAEANTDAARIRAEADADRIRMESESRERYVEMGRLTEQRASHLSALDAEIADRQSMVLSIASDLQRLAADFGDTAAVGLPSAIAAHRTGGIEVIVPVERGVEG